jgi:hypothetical protein
MARCLDDASLNSNAVQRCSLKCSEAVDKVHEQINHELGQLNDRVQRAILTCNDQAKDMIDASPANSDAASKFAQDCATKSLRSHAAFVQGIHQRIIQSISQ